MHLHQIIAIEIQKKIIVMANNASLLPVAMEIANPGCDGTDTAIYHIW